MTVSVHPLIDADRERWNELWNGYLTFYGQTLTADITQQTWQRLLTPGEGHDGFKAVDEAGRTIGIAHFLFHRSTWTDGWYCYLEDIFIDPGARKCGAASALIAAVEKAARDKGCARVYLATQNSNTTARTLYEKTMTLSPFVQYRKQLD